MQLFNLHIQTMKLAVEAFVITVFFILWATFIHVLSFPGKTLGIRLHLEIVDTYKLCLKYFCIIEVTSGSLEL